jgi:Domain of unknown function (DUF4365)
VITEQHIEEGLSRACVQAIAAKSGLIISRTELDYGIDGTFSEVSIINERRCQSGFSLHYQLKASIKWQQKEDKIIYSLEAKTYNDLIEMGANGAVPCILILLTLPKNREQWLECVETRVTIGGGCYWYYPTGSRTPNEVGKTIYIPQQNLLTPESAIALLNKVKTGEF